MAASDRPGPGGDPVRQVHARHGARGDLGSAGVLPRSAACPGGGFRDSRRPGDRVLHTQRRLFRLGTALAATLVLALAPRGIAAQTVVEVQGGGSSLLGGYGATANYWHAGYDGWVGLGYLNGLRIGAFLRTGFKKDTLRIGNDALVLRFPTDLFSTGSNLLVQGVSYTGGTAADVVPRLRRRQLGRSGGPIVPGGQSRQAARGRAAAPPAHRPHPPERRRRVRPSTDDHAGRPVAGHAGPHRRAGGRHGLRSGLRGLERLLPPRRRRDQVVLRVESPSLPAGRCARAEPGRGGPGEHPDQLQRHAQSVRRFRQAELRAGLGRHPAGRSGPSGNSFFAAGRVREFRLAGGLYDSRARASTTSAPTPPSAGRSRPGSTPRRSCCRAGRRAGR